MAPLHKMIGIEHQLPTEFGYRNIAHQDDLLYMADRGSGTNIFALAEINDADGATYVSQLNINRPSGGMRDIAIYRDTLYMLGVNNGNIYTLDIRKYRPVAKRTKTTIYPSVAEAGDTMDLTQFSPDAERFTFDVGFKKPPHLSINTSNELVVGSGPTVLVKLKAINRIDATETESFGFYLIIRRVETPVWRKVSALTMRAGSSYDLFQLVDADKPLPQSLSVLDDPDRLAAVSLTAFSQSAQLAGFRISQREKEAGVRILRSTSMWCRESGIGVPSYRRRVCFGIGSRLRA